MVLLASEGMVSVVKGGEMNDDQDLRVEAPDGYMEPCAPEYPKITVGSVEMNDFDALWNKFKPAEGNPPLLARLFGKRVTSVDSSADYIATVKMLRWRGQVYVTRVTVMER